MNVQIVKLEQQEMLMNQLDESFIRSLLRNRPDNSTKHDFGHALIVAGSRGKMGAAVLASNAALVSGCGLLTAHIPARGEIVLQSSVPEAMVSFSESTDHLSDLPDLNHYTGIGIGPGIGNDEPVGLVVQQLLQRITSPIVIDADAINWISNKRELLNQIPQNAILTPHEKEFLRLIGKSLTNDDLTSIQKEWSIEHNVIIVRKCHNTVITDSDGTIYINTTGNSGLAKGGSGDVLTGMITSFLAQGYSPIESACIGTYIHGKAADIAVRRVNKNALLASDLIGAISEAFNEIGTN